MNTQANKSFVLLFLFALCLTSSALTIKSISFISFQLLTLSKEYQIHDLEHSSSQFADEISQWKSSPNHLPQAFEFSPGISVLTPSTPQSPLTRTFTSLSPHNKVYLTLEVLLFETWTKSDFIRLAFSDDQEDFIFNEKILEFVNINNDIAPITLTIIIPHASDLLDIKITSSSNSYGIRNLKLLLSTQEISQKEEAEEELTCFINTPFPIKSPCDHQHDLPCDSSCGTCYGSQKEQCLSCPLGTTYNGKECSSCDESCETCSGPSQNQCLSCDSEHFLTKEGTCHPYIEAHSSRILTDFACGKQEKWVYPDLSCKTECEEPFVTVVISGNKYCYPPCTGSYYYPNEYTCSLYCIDPYEAYSNSYYFTCEFPDHREGVDVLVLVLDILNRIGLILYTLFIAGDLFPLIAIGTAKMLQYVKFLDISYESNLLKRFHSQDYNSMSLSFGPNGGESLKNRFSHLDLPLGYSRWGMLTSFIYNYWQYFISLLIIFGLIGILKGVIWLSKYKTIKRLPIETLKIGEKMAWNFVVMFMYSCLIDIFMFAFLDWIFTHVSSASDGLSFCFSIILYAVLCKFLWIHGWFLRKIYVAKKLPIEKSPGEIEKIYKKYETFQIIYKGAKDTSLIHQSFLLIYTVRLLIFGLLIATLTNHPLASILLVNLLSCLMLAYLFLRRPLEDKVTEILLFVFEVMLLVYNICVLSLAGLDNSQSPSLSTQKGIGVFLLVIKIIFNFVIFGFFIFKLVQAYLRMQKEAQFRKRGVPVNERRPMTNKAQPSTAQSPTTAVVENTGLLPYPAGGELDPSASLALQKGQENNALFQPSPVQQDVFGVIDPNSGMQQQQQYQHQTEPPTSYRMNNTSMLLNPERSFIEDELPAHQRASQSNYLLPNPSNTLMNQNSNTQLGTQNSNTQLLPQNNTKSTLIPTPTPGGPSYTSADVTLGKRPRAMMEDDDLEIFASLAEGEDFEEEQTPFPLPSFSTSVVKPVAVTTNTQQPTANLGSPITRQSIENKPFQGLVTQEVPNKITPQPANNNMSTDFGANSPVRQSLSERQPLVTSPEKPTVNNNPVINPQIIPPATQKLETIDAFASNKPNNITTNLPNNNLQSTAPTRLPESTIPSNMTATSQLNTGTAQTRLPEQQVPASFEKSVPTQLNTNPLNPQGSSAYKPFVFDENAMKLTAKPTNTTNSYLNQPPTKIPDNNLQLKPGATEFNLNKFQNTPAFSNNQNLPNQMFPGQETSSPNLSPIKMNTDLQKSPQTTLPSPWDIRSGSPWDIRTGGESPTKMPEKTPTDIVDMLKAQNNSPQRVPPYRDTSPDYDPYMNNPPGTLEVRDIGGYLMGNPNEWGLSRALNRGKAREDLSEDDMSPGKGMRNESLYLRQMRMKKKVGVAMKFSHLANAGGLILNQTSAADLINNNNNNHQNDHLRGQTFGN